MWVCLQLIWRILLTCFHLRCWFLDLSPNHVTCASVNNNDVSSLTQLVSLLRSAPGWALRSRCGTSAGKTSCGRCGGATRAAPTASSSWSTRRRAPSGSRRPRWSCSASARARSGGSRAVVPLAPRTPSPSSSWPTSRDGRKSMFLPKVEQLSLLSSVTCKSVGNYWLLLWSFESGVRQFAEPVHYFVICPHLQHFL